MREARVGEQVEAREAERAEPEEPPAAPVEPERAGPLEHGEHREPEEAAIAYRIVESGKALTLSSADFPTTNCPPHTTAVVVANSTPSVVVLVLTRLLRLDRGVRRGQRAAAPGYFAPGRAPSMRISSHSGRDEGLSTYLTAVRPRRFISIRWWLPAAFALIAAVTALAVAQVFQSQSQHALRAKAEDLAAGSAVGAASRVAGASDLAEARARADEQARRRRVALFLFDAEGRLLTDATSLGARWAAVPNSRELLGEALAGRRIVQSLDDGRRVTVALPLHNGPAAALVEVAARPDLLAASSIVRNRIWVAAAWATLIGAIAGIFVSLLITFRVRRIGGAAAAIAEGEFGSELNPRFPDELGRLATAVDTMRTKLRASFGQLASERDQLRALIEQLQEGVIAVRQDLTVVVANARASALLGRTVTEGEPLANPWPASDLRALAHRLFEASTTDLVTMRVAPALEHAYAVTGVPSAGSGTAVIVITDVTEQQRRERAEREFVANAAHELRTPLTAIASAVEVLQLGRRTSRRSATGSSR